MPPFLGGRTDWGFAFRVFLTNKLIVLAVTIVANWEGWRRLFTVDMAYEVLVRTFRFFDANWYVAIAEDGYVNLKETAFFPLFPLLVRLFGEVLPAGPLAAGVFISNLAFLGLLYGFVRLARLDLDDPTAHRAVWLLGLYPTSFYFSAAYTEALFLLLMVFSLYWMRTRRWAGAGLAGGLAALTRNMGILLALPFLLEYWSSLRERGVGLRELLSRDGALRRLRGLLWAGAIGAGGLTYVIFLWWRFGEPFAFAKVQALYGRDSLMPWSTLFEGYDYGLRRMIAIDLPLNWTEVYYTTQLLFVSLVLVVLVASLGRMRWSYWVIILYSFSIPLLGPSTDAVVDYFISFSRYSLVIPPLFLGLSPLLRNRWVYRAYLTVSVGLLVVFLFAWAGHNWVA